MPSPRSHVAFRAPQFDVARRNDGSLPDDLAEAIDITEGHAPGKDVLEAILVGLRVRGLECSTPEEHDEFMWTSDVRSHGHSWLLAAGFFGDDSIGEWLAFVEPRGVLRRLRLRASDPGLVELAAKLHSVLAEDLGAETRWYTTKEWMSGPQGPGAQAP